MRRGDRGRSCRWGPSEDLTLHLGPERTLKALRLRDLHPEQGARTEAEQGRGARTRAQVRAGRPRADPNPGGGTQGVGLGAEEESRNPDARRGCAAGSAGGGATAEQGREGGGL